MAHVVQVVYTPIRGGDGSELVAIRLPDRESVRHYLRGEAPSAAVCLALEAASRSVARAEVPSGDGFTVRVEFVNEVGEPIAVPADGLRPASGRGDLHANMAWVRDHRRQYARHWVALRDGELVVASSVSELALREQLANRTDARELTVLYVEPEVLDGPGDAAFAEMEAVADADDG